MRTIPVNEPILGDREAELVLECVSEGWVSSSGRFIEQFEGEWAARCERSHGVAVSSGTTALQLAVAILQLPPGSEIIMPSFTIISCALAAILNECKPIFVDCDPETWCIDAEAVERAITKKTRAVMPVHIYGHPVDMDPILELASTHDLVVIEDAAEAHGASYLSDRDGSQPRWRPCGSMGDISIFSFYANKLVTTGEGGMLVTDNDDLADRARRLRNLAFQPGRRFVHEEIGFNFRLTNLQAALGVAQLERFDESVAKKRWLAERYGIALGHIRGLQLPPAMPWARSIYWMYGVVLDEECGLDAMELAQLLTQQGVETRPFFLGLHEQPVLERMGLTTGGEFPVTESLAQRGLYLPSSPTITESEIDQVVSAVDSALAR